MLVRPNELPPLELIVLMRKAFKRHSENESDTQAIAQYLNLLMNLDAEQIEAALAAKPPFDFSYELKLALTFLSDGSSGTRFAYYFKILRWQLMLDKDTLHDYHVGLYQRHNLLQNARGLSILPWLTDLLVKMRQKGIHKTDPCYAYLLSIFTLVANDEKLRPYTSINDIRCFLKSASQLHPDSVKEDCERKLQKVIDAYDEALQNLLLLERNTECLLDAMPRWHNMVKSHPNKEIVLADCWQLTMLVEAFWQVYVACDVNQFIQQRMQELLLGEDENLSFLDILLISLMCDGRGNQLTSENKRLVFSVLAKFWSNVVDLNVSVHIIYIAEPLFMQFIKGIDERKKLFFIYDIMRPFVLATKVINRSDLAQRVDSYNSSEFALQLLLYLCKFMSWNEYITQLEARCQNDDIERLPFMYNKNLSGIACALMKYATATTNLDTIVEFYDGLFDLEENGENLSIHLRFYFDNCLAEDEKNKARAACDVFLQKCEKINNKLPEDKRLSYRTTLFMHAITIIDLIEIMGAESAFLFLRGLVNTSLQDLFRFLQKCNVRSDDYRLTIKRVFHKFKKEKNGLDEISPYEFAEIMTMINILFLMVNDNAAYQALLRFLSVSIESCLSLTELRDKLNEYLVRTFAAQLGLAADNVQIDFEMIQEYFTKLVFAHLKMENNPYQQVYQEMLCADLDARRGFDSFVHDTTQSSKVGSALSLYNRNTRLQLQNGGVDTALAMNYRAKQTFTSMHDDTVNIDTLYKNVMNYIKLVGQICQRISSEVPATHVLHRILSGTYRHYLKLEAELAKSEKSTPFKQIKNLTSSSKNNLLQKIFANVKRVVAANKAHPFEQSITELNEFTRHLSDAYTQLQVESNKAGRKTSVLQKKDFYIEQWDKRNLTTLFLGDYVGCCLATDGAQFPAIVQRRMDDALLFHVVRPLGTSADAPVALSWLFFAHDKESPKDIYVVANFFEIRAGLGMKEKLRRTILANLLIYTGEYAKAVGAKGFLIRQMHYGFMDRDLTFLPKQKLLINKVGGYFSIDGKNDTDSSKLYYLEAVGKNEFHVYDEKLVRERLMPLPNVATSKANLFTGKADDTLANSLFLKNNQF